LRGLRFRRCWGNAIKAAMNSYVNVKGQKSGTIKGSVTPKANVRINVHPVVPRIKVK
jgi:hypothetical protein